MTVLSRAIEAMIFASQEPVGEASLRDFLEQNGASPEDLPQMIAEISARYDGHGIELVSVAKGWQFRTCVELASMLTTVVERPRRLSRAAMEALAVVAYHQPCTRAEIETIRGVALNQSVLDALLGDDLIVPRGRKEVPGRPVLWGTSGKFLSAFGLVDLNALPRREELLVEPVSAGAPDEDGIAPVSEDGPT